MTRVVVEVKEVALADAFDITVPVARAMTEPPPALDIGLVELNEITGTTQWTTGPVPPTVPGAAIGDMYLGVDGSVWQWDGDSWTDTGTNISSSDTPEEMLAKIITVDGSGSTLDADLLDGHDSPYFATDADLGTVETAIGTLQTRVTNVENVNTTQDTAINLKAPIDSPAFTGTPTAPTPTPGDNDTSLATTAFVTTAIGNRPPDAPSDGQSYGRKNAAWVDVAEEAPADGITYGRKNGAWVASVGGASISDAPPAGPITQGQLWWESDSGNTYVWFDDGTSAQWIQIAGGAGFALCWSGDAPPASPVPNMLWFRTTNGRLYIYYDDGNSLQWCDTSGTASTPVKTAQARNRVTNGAMQHSQENGNAGSVHAAAVSWYPADQFLTVWSLATGTASAVRNAPATGDFSISLWTQVGATFTANSYASINHRIEGNDVADFGWGAAGAKQAILRFSALHQTGGTFTVGLQNSAQDRAFLAAYTLPANVWKDVAIVVPGDVTGTWLKDSGIGINIQWQLGTGSTYTGVAGWQAGNKNNLPGSTNGLAAANTGLAITNVGLHLDPDNTGIAPPFQMPNNADELRHCRRYWNYLPSILINLNTANSSTYYGVTMRVSPTISGNPAVSVGANGPDYADIYAPRAYTNITLNARM
jgi:hypothetical protein